jgi:hypothetical protein
MTQTTLPTETSAVGSPGREGLAHVGLIAGAAALAVGRLLTLPGGDAAQRLQQAEGHDLRITVEAVLVVFGLIALMGGFLGVSSRIRQRGATLATVGSVLCLAGCALIVQVVLDPVTAAAARVGDGGAMRQFLEQLDRSPALAVITPVAVLGYFFGPFLVTLAAHRAGLAARWLPWAMLVSLPLQSVGEALRGPFFAQVADAFLQLLLVVLVGCLVAGLRSARLSASGSPSS